MAKILNSVNGTHDILPAAYPAFEYVMRTAQDIAARYGFARMETPIFEFSEVFHRTLGDTSDVVSKETYTFEDRGGRSLTLRPEFTAAIVRAFLSNGLQQYVPFKAFYAGPAFRYERPQKGRQRQFHQFGVELLGAEAWEADVEIMALAHHMLDAFGLADRVSLQLNTLGDTESRVHYRDALVRYLGDYKNTLSEDSLVRLEKNPLRILDSKAPEDQEIIRNAPNIHEHLNEHSSTFFAHVKAGLEALAIPFSVNPWLVRGMDYYNHSVFEFVTDQLGAQGTVLAGGRYDGLVEMMGGQPTAGIGFAAGVERLVALRQAMGVEAATDNVPCAAIIPMSDAHAPKCWAIASELRHAGLAIEIAYRGKPAKRMQRADKAGIRYAIILGDDEAAASEVTLKEFSTGEQIRVAQSALAKTLLTKH
jgi:histidyl-tRNA synthetase